MSDAETPNNAQDHEMETAARTEAEPSGTEQAGTAGADREHAGESEYPLPPPTLEYLILSFRTQAEIHLGLLYFGEEKDRPKPDFRLARHTIDMLGMLEEKTRGNLTLEEKRLLENSLTELRFRYVQKLEESGKKQ